MPQSWMVVVHIKAYSFKLHKFKEGFWNFLVKNRNIHRTKDWRALLSYVFTRNRAMTFSFTQRANIMVQLNAFPPECDGLVHGGCWGQSLEIRSPGQ